MPRPVMRHILEKFGFIATYEDMPEHYDYPVEVWYRPVTDSLNSGALNTVRTGSE